MNMLQKSTSHTTAPIDMLMKLEKCPWIETEVHTYLLCNGMLVGLQEA
jgi:hypothetical protein